MLLYPTQQSLRWQQSRLGDDFHI